MPRQSDHYGNNRNQIRYLSFHYVDISNLGDQFNFCLSSFSSKVADQIECKSAFAAHVFWQLIIFAHLQKIHIQISTNQRMS